MAKYLVTDDKGNKFQIEDDKPVGPSLAPQGTAQPNPSGPKPPNEFNAQTGLGTLANMGSMGAAGAQLGGMFGPVGAAAGGVAGVGAGMFMEPSKTPMTDLGATVAEMGANALIPGSGKALGRLARMVGLPTSVALGAAVGNKGDQAAGFTSDTDWGKIGIYTAGSSVASVLGSFAREATPAAQAAGKLGTQTGTEIPLTMSESTGMGKNLEGFFARGSGTASKMAERQSQTATQTFEKILNTPIDQTVKLLSDTTKYQRTLKEDVLGNWTREWSDIQEKQAKGQFLKPSQYPKAQAVANSTSDVTDESGANAFAKAFNLDADESRSFLQAVNTSPENFVNQFNQKSAANPLQGYIKLRAVMSVMDQSGLTTESAKLGQAVVMNDMYKTFSTPIVDGKQYAQGLKDSIEHLKLALPPDDLAGLKDLATVLETANPAEKVGNAESKGSGVMKYLSNKIMFSAGSISAGALAGTNVGAGNVATILIGGAAGALIALPVYSLVGKILENPATGKLLIAASKGDSTAATKIARSFTSNTIQQNVPKNPLQGMFGQ